MKNPMAAKTLRARTALVASLACLPFAAAQAQQVASLADLSLEQLGNIQVTSVSGRSEPLRSAAASVFVINSEDIRRSAATNLPEVLRLAPNLQVAQSSAGSYAISARGFNNQIANKLLVLIDGRTLYSNLLSGVFWDASTVMLEDIERIEVISGPGGTIWGANAVNGVINIITRDAAATQGTLASITRSGKGGREAVRYGGTLGESGHFRIYGLATDRDRTRLASGVQRADDGSMSQVGFRADLTIDAAQLTLQGDAYHGGDLPASGLKPRLQGGNLLARWNSHFDDGSPYQIQAYYDYAARDETAVFRNTSRNASVEFRHEPVMPAGQHLLYGAGYRGGQDSDDPSAAVLLNPSVRPLSWANVFVQHQVGFAEKWQLTLGAKAERNSYTGTELLPSARVAFQHSEQNMTWAALSRAVRAPSRIDRDFFFPGNAPFIIVGGPRFRSEIANVVELGHKGQLSSSFTYSGTLFRQYYNGLRSGIPGAFPATVENQIEGSGQGVEASAQWQVQDGWRLGAGYFGLRKKLRFSSGVVNAAYVADLGNDPRDQWTLRSSHTIGRAEVDLLVRHVGQLPSPLVPAYTAVDARLAYRVSPALELSLLAQNLFERRHVEFNAAGVASQIEPRVSIKAVLQF